MRSISLANPVVVATLGCVVLSGCGTRNAATVLTPEGTPVSAASRLDDPRGEPEMRFLELITRITLGCAPDAPDASDGKREDVVPRPEDLPGWEGASTPRYGPGETPPGVPNADGDIPVPLPSDASTPPESTLSRAKQTSLEDVPLTEIEKCSANEHVQRVREAFKNTKTTSFQVMQKTLTRLDYPASRIHRMPSRADAPRARLDLRFMGSREALEVTSTASGVIVEVFGAPETDDVKVTDVRRKSARDVG